MPLLISYPVVHLISCIKQTACSCIKGIWATFRVEVQSGTLDKIVEVVAGNILREALNWKTSAKQRSTEVECAREEKDHKTKEGFKREKNKPQVEPIHHHASKEFVFSIRNKGCVQEIGPY